jgi:hypothetical protein
MIATHWLAAILACAQPGPTARTAPDPQAQQAPHPIEGAPTPRPVTSRIAEVTVYQGQAQVAAPWAWAAWEVRCDR